MAGKIYEPTDVPFNAFDSGLHAVLAFSKIEPTQLRDNLVVTLVSLEEDDPLGRNFYARRRVYFQGLTLVSPKPENRNENFDPAQIQKQARRALEDKDINALERLAEEILRPRRRLRLHQQAPLNRRP